ncbi:MULTISPECIES: rhomboid-like protein [Actinomycetes]|uniref:rhomboid-like protein n=1 Tax=Actinomycetes TaxID=1760 RepID=UPI0018F8A2D4|nr:MULTISPECIES: rhomboid-like protein [Actinomycetes]
MPSHSGRMSLREPDPAPRPARSAATTGTPRKWRFWSWLRTPAPDPVSPTEPVGLLEPATAPAGGTRLADPLGSPTATAVLTQDDLVQPVPRPAFLAAIPVSWRPKRAWLSLVPSPRSTPFTFGYLVLLLGTSLLIRFGSAKLTDKLLAVSSTDAHNMARHPLTALLTSAFWIADGGWLPYAVIFAIAVAPFERRFGGLRTALVFFSGHVLATIATELPVMALIRTDVLPHSAGRWLDIGVSYGFLTTAGVLVALLRGRARIVGIVALELFVIGVYVTDDPATLASVVTLLGHACAAHFGLLVWGPRLRSVPRVAR